ncbi:MULTISPECIES: hypothetical protein [Eubacteriales]|uniref:hypothetical protein n=1 Tax=Eubacteriales TaxID=186802 RepID=UPI000B389BB7|nr:MULTISPECIES: hypothetical protein [Eubacteriales]MDY4167794.1 hypothetical protein [Fournierella sp.]OUP24703.1 hypothetical protein B5F28_05700 [Gemmiger sp. An194]
MSDLEQKFLQEVTEKAAEAKLVCGWDAAHFLAFLQKRGPVRAMAEQARRGAVSEAFDRLAAKGRLDLSPEAVASKNDYADLFDDEAVNFFLEVLCEKGYFTAG